MTDETNFEDVPMQEWLTANDITEQLAVSYDRVVQILRDIRQGKYGEPIPPYDQIGRSWVYHPAFIDIAKTRKTKPGVKSRSEKTNED